MSVLKIKDDDGNWINIPSIKGQDGLTTSITVNGTTYEQENGNIDLGDLATEEEILEVRVPIYLGGDVLTAKITEFEPDETTKANLISLIEKTNDEEYPKIKLVAYNAETSFAGDEGTTFYETIVRPELTVSPGGVMLNIENTINEIYEMYNICLSTIKSEDDYIFVATQTIIDYQNYATKTDLESKQDTLTAGDNITITDNEISAKMAGLNYRETDSDTGWCSYGSINAGDWIHCIQPMSIMGTDHFNQEENDREVIITFTTKDEQDPTCLKPFVLNLPDDVTWLNGEYPFELSTTYMITIRNRKIMVQELPNSKLLTEAVLDGYVKYEPGENNRKVLTLDQINLSTSDYEPSGLSKGYLILANTNDETEVTTMAMVGAIQDTPSIALCKYFLDGEGMLTEKGIGIQLEIDDDGVVHAKLGVSGSDGEDIEGYIATEQYVDTQLIPLIPETLSNSESTATIATLSDNMKFSFLEDITELTITASSQTEFGRESTIHVITGDTIEFTYPDTIKTIGDCTLSPNKEYVISIENNIMVVGEVNSNE